MAMRRSRPSGGLESDVMACLAAAGEPLTPAEVRARLGGELAYTTVMTTLVRLHAKHALARTRHGRAFAYELIGGSDDARASVTAHQMQKLLDAGADRATVLSCFVDGLDQDAEQLLRRLLADHPAVESIEAPAGQRAARGRR